jgi:Ca2+-binding RTX toxin-like protein
VIYGNAGANELSGGAGADLMAGQGGDDSYYVDNAADVVVEGAGGGNDRIYASASYVLAAGVQVEILATNGYFSTTAINLTGNELANILSGNIGNNVLDGGAGADSLNGGEGNDWYYVDHAGDTVTDPGSQGTDDRVYASVSYTLGAGAEIETLMTTSFTGTTAINLTGNAFANDVYGNAGANVLDGKGGADLLVGLGGADTFAFTTALGAGNVDTISGFSVADDTIRLENAVFTGLAAGALAAGAFNTGSFASQANDRIIYNSATGALLFDADGLGGAAGVQFATVAAGLALTAADFIVV